MTSALFAESQQAALFGLPNPGRQGNREPGFLLHGVFRCKGEDEWCVIAIRDEDEWATFRRVAGDGVLPEKTIAVGDDQLEETVEAWTRLRGSREIMETLQAAGLEAGRVQSAREMVDEDPHLRARGYLAPYDHLLGQTALADGPTYGLSATPGSIRRAGPVYGGDNEYVFGEVLGLELADIHRLRESGVIA
jgi:crotonobetainyl-CoA:carnitine CoA-transferase CaiB-like acyl-CoA transferase